MAHDSHAHIGQRIREIRECERELTIRAAAGLAGEGVISPSMWSMIENGERRLENRKHLDGIARALRVSPTELGQMPVAGVLDSDVAAARAGLTDVEAALTDVALGERTTIPRTWEAIAADVKYLGKELKVKADLPAQTKLIPGLIRELNALLAGQPDNRGELLEALACVLHSAAMAAKAIGSVGVPGLAALRMREAVDQLDHPRWDGLARLTRAQTLGSGARDRMRELSLQAADELQSHIGSDAPCMRLYGMLHLNAALACAAQERSVGAAEHLEEASQAAAAVPEPPEMGFDGFANLSCVPTNVQIWKVAITLELGDPDEVLHLSRDICAERLQAWSRQGAYWADLGRAQARSKATRPDAIVSFLRAEELAPVATRANPFTREAVRDLHRRTKRDSRAGRDLRGLAYRMGLAA